MSRLSVAYLMPLDWLRAAGRGESEADELRASFGAKVPKLVERWLQGFASPNHGLSDGVETVELFVSVAEHCGWVLPSRHVGGLKIAQMLEVDAALELARVPSGFRLIDLLMSSVVVPGCPGPPAPPSMGLIENADLQAAAEVFVRGELNSDNDIVDGAYAEFEDWFELYARKKTSDARPLGLLGFYM